MRVPGLGLTLDYAHFTRAGIPDSRIEPLTARATHFHARCAQKGRLQTSFKNNTIDFSSALTLKLKLTNAARDGARVAAADSGSDLGKPIGVPASVGDSYQVVDNHLLAEKINDCGLNGTTPTATGLVWKSPALTGCPGGTGMVLTIDRGCISKQTLNGVSTDVVNTCVTIQYPYQWRYGGVAGLVGGTFIGPTTINVTATALNEN